MMTTMMKKKKIDANEGLPRAVVIV